MSYELLDDNPKKIRLRTITSSQIISLATFLNNTSEVGEPLYATDSKQLYIHDGNYFEALPTANRIIFNNDEPVSLDDEAVYL